MRKIPSWDQYFIMQAIIASTKSKDPSRQVGCVIVDKNNRQISMGYNRFISKVDEKKITWDKGDTYLILKQSMHMFCMLNKMQFYMQINH